MPDIKICKTCKGQGTVHALVNAHDDKKEWVKCWDCHGKGTITEMTEQEERDYWADYW